jgi:hypothetical protein
VTATSSVTITAPPAVGIMATPRQPVAATGAPSGGHRLRWPAVTTPPVPSPSIWTATPLWGHATVRRQQRATHRRGGHQQGLPTTIG